MAERKKDKHDKTLHNDRYNTTQKTKERKTRIPQKTGDDLR